MDNTWNLLSMTFEFVVQTQEIHKNLSPPKMIDSIVSIKAEW